MSNEVGLFSQHNVAIPDYLKSDADTKKLVGGSDFKRISIRGNVFRMIANGQEVAKNLERHMNVVVVRAADETSRTFYEGEYDPNTKAPPTCFSHDGVKPDAKSTTPQSNFCTSCPQNIKGSGKGDSRACRYSRRVAVVLEHDISGPVYGLSIPAQSLFGNDVNKMGLQQYARQLASHNLGINAVVTELRFDLDSPTPKLQFKAVRPLTMPEYAAVQSKRDSTEAMDAVNVPVHEQDGVESAPAPSTASRVQGTISPPAPAPASEEPQVRQTGSQTTPKVVDAQAALDAWVQSDD